MPRVDDIAARFASVDQELRLAMLLDYARKLPPLPDELRALKEKGVNRVPECMTPVYLWMLKNPDGTLQMHADVADEAPTVRGFLSIIHAMCNGQPLGFAQEIPSDLISRLKLDGAIRMQRSVGVNAIIARIKREAAALVAQNGADP